MMTVTYDDHKTATYAVTGFVPHTRFELQPDGDRGTKLVLSAVGATDMMQIVGVGQEAIRFGPDPIPKHS
jgi:hypothetical protein